MERSHGSPFECPICFETFDDDTRLPCTLPCGHSCCISHISNLTQCFHCRAALPDIDSISPSFALRDAAMIMKQSAGSGTTTVDSKSSRTESRRSLYKSLKPKGFSKKFLTDSAAKLFQTKPTETVSAPTSTSPAVAQSAPAPSPIPQMQATRPYRSSPPIQASEEHAREVDSQRRQIIDRMQAQHEREHHQQQQALLRYFEEQHQYYQQQPPGQPRPVQDIINEILPPPPVRVTATLTHMPERLQPTVEPGSKKTDCGHFCSSRSRPDRCCGCTPRSAWYVQLISADECCPLCNVRKQTALAFHRAMDNSEEIRGPILAELRRRVVENERQARNSRQRR